MNLLGEAIGQICKILLPIPEEVYYGNPNGTIAICTLSSMTLLKELSRSSILDDVAMIGRLLSENKGIDSLVHTIVHNPNLSTLVLCGVDVWGHKAGKSLMALHKNGISPDGMIIGSPSPDPVLTTSLDHVKTFQKQISLIDMIGQTSCLTIINNIRNL